MWGKEMIDDIETETTPEEVMGVVNSKDIYRDYIYQEIFSKTPTKDSSGLPRKIELDFGQAAVKDEPKWELDWLVGCIKIATLSKLLADNIILRFNVETREVLDDFGVGGFFYNTAFITYEPKTFLEWYSKYAKFKLNDKVVYDEAKSKIIWGSIECKIPPNTKMSAVCRVMFSRELGDNVEYLDFTEQPDWGDGESDKIAYDTIRQINKKVNLTFGWPKIFDMKKGVASMIDIRSEL